MRLNRKTHEGAKAVSLEPIKELRRTVMAALLWEDSFYENGESVAQRVQKLVPTCRAAEVANLALEARTGGKLRHMPLMLMRELMRHPASPKMADELAAVIKRADELTEFLAIYWKDGRCPLSHQTKKGLAQAFKKFDAYQLAKYNRSGPVKLRDVLFLCHAKAEDQEQDNLWKKLIDNTLPSPDTWEVSLSGGADKGATFTRLLQENKLGYLALLRNLRNMVEAGVDRGLMKKTLLDGAEKSQALPFRFVAAGRAAPALEPELDRAMQLSLKSRKKLAGRTWVLVDVSGSMDARLSAKSDLNRLEAASALAVLVCGLAEEARVFTFSNGVVEVVPRASLALIEAISRSQSHQGTELGRAIKTLNKKGNYDRLIVITDEQSQDQVPEPNGRGYLINVATYQNGVGYGPWVHIDGFSEATVDYIQAYENDEDVAQ